jgi:hypothetical protein
VRESDLRVLFKRQAASELPSASINIPAARRIGRSRLLRRRAGAFGSPVLAAGAVVAVVLLAGLFAPGPREPAITQGSPAAPTAFNPLVPYASVTWYPYRPTTVGATDWRAAVLLRASSRAEATEVALYVAGWCTQQSASLSCGATASDNRLVMTVTAPAPDVQGQAAYWGRYAGGDLGRLRQLASTPQMLAFQYATGGWAVVESTGKPADLLRVAASVRYRQASPLRFPFQLTGLPRAWSDVLYATFTHAAPGAQAPTADEVLLGSPADRPGTGVRDALIVQTSTRTTQGPKCRTATSAGPVGQASQPAPTPSQASRPVACPSRVINGYRVFLNTPPSPGKQTLFAPNAGGLYLYEETTGPGAQLSPASVLAHHLLLLGPNLANWTTAPLSP